MKLPNNYFDNLSASRYRQYLKLLPDIKNENTRIITTLILTFASMSFFGVFAINPTLSTIVTLKKQLADSVLVNQKLDTKISALSSLQQEYNLLEPELPVVFDAIPQKAKTANLLGQIIALSQKTKVKTTSLSVSEIQLTGEKNPSNEANFTFSMQAQGTYNDLLTFTKSLTQINRIVSIDLLTINKSVDQNNLTLSLRGQGYFKKDL